MDKRTVFTIFSLLLIMQLVPFSVQAEESVSRRVMVSGSVSPGQTKTYSLYENLTRDSFVIVSIKLISGEGKFVLQKASEQIGEYSVYSISSASPQSKIRFWPTALPDNGSDYEINVSSSPGQAFEYAFFYDVADVLAIDNSKIIPFESGVVGYYADVDRGHVLSLNLTSVPQEAEFDLLVIPVTCLALSGSYLPSAVSTFHVPTPKSIEFRTESSQRYLIFVMSTRGAGNFSLTSSRMVDPVEDALGNLRSRIDYLNNLIDNLILICVASFFVAAINVILYCRLRKTLMHNSGTVAKQ